RPDPLGQRRHGVRALQPEQGWLPARAGRHAADAGALSADGVRAAPQRTAVPAQLPARELARLPVLGYRAGAVRRPIAHRRRSNQRSVWRRRCVTTRDALAPAAGPGPPGAAWRPVADAYRVGRWPAPASAAETPARAACPTGTRGRVPTSC